MAKDITAAEEARSLAIRNCQYHRVPLDDIETQAGMEHIRQASFTMIQAIYEFGDNNRPREQAMAYKAVEDACMYAIAGLARGRESRVRPD